MASTRVQRNASNATSKGKAITVISEEEEILTVLEEQGEQKEELQGEKFQEVQALVIEYETAEILKAEATLRNLYAEAVAREREAQIEAAEEETKVLEEVEGMMQEAREQKVAAQRRAHEQAREEVRQAAATREKEIAAAQRRAKEMVSAVLKNRPLIWEEPAPKQESAGHPSPRMGA